MMKAILLAATTLVAATLGAAARADEHRFALAVELCKSGDEYACAEVKKLLRKFTTEELSEACNKQITDLACIEFDDRAEAANPPRWKYNAPRAPWTNCEQEFTRHPSANWRYGGMEARG